MSTQKIYKHAEAYCLMQYQDTVTGEIELIWNSRDGVTPFIITSRQGNEARHVNWSEDRCVPEFVPPNGSRIFVDASPDDPEVRRRAREYVNKYWDKEIFGRSMRDTLRNPFGAQMTKNEAVNHFVAQWTKPGSPMVREVK